MILPNQGCSCSTTLIVMSSSQDEAYSSGHFKDVKGLVMGMLETYNYEEVINLMSLNFLLHFPHIRHCTKQPIIFYSMMSVSHWSSCIQCHRGDCPLTPLTAQYVIDKLLPFPIPLVKAMLLFSGEQSC